MKTLKYIFMLMSVLIFSQQNFSQSTSKTYDFKKGEVLDVLIVTTKPEKREAYKRYRETAFPIAIKRSFELLKVFKILDNTQGNLEPTGFILGKWNNREKREGFLSEIENLVPDFHEQRRDIWSIFNLTYYEMSQNISFTISTEKFNVVTAYWQKDQKSIKKFKTELDALTKSKNGKVILELTNGISPFMYYYAPDLLIFTEWESKEAFENFHKENLKMNHNGLKHVNQFVIN